MMRRAGLCGLLLLACAPGRAPEAARPVAEARAEQAAPREAAASEAEPRAGHFVIRGAEIVGVGVADVEVKDGRIAAIGAVAAGPPELPRAGRWIVPAAIDSHVHLSYLPGGRRMLDGGVAAAVDLAAPLTALREREAPPELVVLPSGPMITARAGYPTRDWGSDGYGLEVDGPAAATEAVETLAAAGARLIKVPVTDGPTLPPATLKAIVTAAHARGLKVAAHALFDRHARTAAEAGVDLLAHVPVEPLQARTVEAWAGRAAISTLSAFGGAAVENLELASGRGDGAVRDRLREHAAGGDLRRGDRSARGGRSRWSGDRDCDDVGAGAVLGARFAGARGAGGGRGREFFDRDRRPARDAVDAGGAGGGVHRRDAALRLTARCARGVVAGARPGRRGGARVRPWWRVRTAFVGNVPWDIS
ncbi:hypothetical protein OV079_44815 [Nannocystis pusilla]|uniref:Amidohydrolase-related domain-containing protein n=1 Tax=Nannocystis pusilla TaxID=889268 RepID=A0A9X3J3X5_9BACT|nr:hypothetical protein [Nannocystis pusilla]MCY1012538.1 hypothetical protein [Nannocystis pusilla]